MTNWREKAWSCENCEKMRATGGNPPDCKTSCPLPVLGDENYLTLEVINRVLPGLFDGFGGISYGNIQVVLDEMGIKDQYDRLDIMDKIIAYAIDYRKSQKKD